MQTEQTEAAPVGADRHLLAAFTSATTTPYPPYINVSEEFDRSVTVYVRGPARPMSTLEGVYPVPGLEVAMLMTAREFQDFLAQLTAQYGRKPS